MNEHVDFIAAFEQARASIRRWERKRDFQASRPQIAPGEHIAAHLRLDGDGPDKAVRVWLREIHPEHARYRRWEFTPSEADALVALETWLGPMGAVALHETDGYLGVLRRVLETSRATGAKVHDARIAATCMLHGVEVLLTADRDFGSFTGLRTRNPLVRAGGKP